MTLDTQMVLDYDIASLEVKEPIADVLLQFLTDMEFRTITRRVAEALRPALDDLATMVGVDGWVVDGCKGDVTPLLR